MESNIFHVGDKAFTAVNPNGNEASNEGHVSVFIEYEGKGEVITESIKITAPDKADRSDQDVDVTPLLTGRRGYYYQHRTMVSWSVVTTVMS